MTNYRAGQVFAYKVRDELQESGYKTTTAAASKGAADLWAAKPGQLLFVQAKKRNGQIPPRERVALYDLAVYCRGAAQEVLPIVAYQPVPRKPIVYRLLTGIGPSDWEPFYLDEVVASA